MEKMINIIINIFESSANTAIDYMDEWDNITEHLDKFSEDERELFVKTLINAFIYEIPELYPYLLDIATLIIRLNNRDDYIQYKKHFKKELKTFEDFTFGDYLEYWLSDDKDSDLSNFANVIKMWRYGLFSFNILRGLDSKRTSELYDIIQEKATSKQFRDAVKYSYNEL